MVWDELLHDGISARELRVIAETVDTIVVHELGTLLCAGVNYSLHGLLPAVTVETTVRDTCH